MEAKQAAIVISDIRTFSIMSQNENYKNKLYETYQYIKRQNITSLEDFTSRKGLQIGAFTYDEITIFDRIKDEAYLEVISKALFNINNHRQEYIDNPHIGDDLDNWKNYGKQSFSR